MRRESNRKIETVVDYLRVRVRLSGTRFTGGAVTASEVETVRWRDRASSTPFITASQADFEFGTL